MSAAAIELVPRGTMLGSQPDAHLHATLVTDGPVRVEVTVRRRADAWALDAIGWLDDEEPAWPVRLVTVGACANRGEVTTALADLLAAAFHHGAAITRVRGRPWAVHSLVSAASRASERRYNRLPAEARDAPWARTAPLGADPPREGVRLKTWHSRLRSLADEPERRVELLTSGARSG
jgi:hypothetical protein